ncbi:MAG: hypothetical protein FWB75_03070 [Oscillospiraceae bacterium]|nr:hypothetical protein [Oscillospiraceae bacterium]
MSSKFSWFEKNVEVALEGRGTSFTEELFRYIDQKGLKDTEVYKRARIDRRQFSKMRKIGYRPSRPIIIALALALELDYAETISLLSYAGYTLSASPSMPFDVIVIQAIQNQRYDIDEVNELLGRYRLPLLGC